MSTKQVVKSKTHVYATVKVKVYAGVWAPGCSVAQISEQACREARSRINALCSNDEGVTVLSADICDIVTKLEVTR